MVYPPGQGKSGEYLMQLWREYLEQYAGSEGDIEGQAIIGAYRSVDILTALSRTLDNDNRYKALIDQRIKHFQEGCKRAEGLLEGLLNGTYSIYNCYNTLSRQFTEGDSEADMLISSVDQQVRCNTESGTEIERSAAALRACFALLGLIAIAMDQDRSMTGIIRKVEQRFAAASKAASSDWEQLLNALYRIVEMMQIVAFLTDADLQDQIDQIATRFKEEDQSKALRFKLRNGFCRLFELGHLLATHMDAML